MWVKRIQLSNFRGIGSCELRCSPGLNVVVGSNGSGKTSLLESIYCLSTGKSFRSAQVRPLVKDGENTTVVFGVLETDSGADLRVGVRRRLGEEKAVQVRIDGRNARSSSELAKLCPVQVVSPEGHRLIEGSPGERRGWVDWSVFHVKQGFLGNWNSYRKALRQRNAWLRSRGNGRESPFGTGKCPWDSVVAETGEAVTLLRKDVVEELIALTLDTLGDVAPRFSKEVCLSFYQGWKNGTSLSAAMTDALGTDRKRGFTQNGPHRAEIRIRAGGRKSDEFLSRGQQKQLMLSLRIAQLKQLEIRNGIKGVLLLDDLAAELDQEHRELALNAVARLGWQCFVTGTERRLIDTDAWSACKVFHVKHGLLEEVV